MKHFLFILMILLLPITLWAGGDSESGDDTLTIMQHKPEIDAQLKDFAKVFEEKTGIHVVVKSCGGDACSMVTQLQADFNAGESPDIFTIDGVERYEQWSDYIDDLSSESWTSLTDVALSVSGKTVGFPVAIEGWGMAYNTNLLQQAGIDPETLTSLGAYRDAFAKLDSMKDTLGIDSVVSMAAGPGMGWVTAHHNINSYLSNGLARDDNSIVDLSLRGEVDATRLQEYVDWVELLFKYANKTVLTTGGYDDQVGAFANQKAIFIHQGNWIEPNLQGANATFPRAYAPHGSMNSVTDGVFVNAPSWFVVNKEGNSKAAKEFLTFMAESEEGHDYIVNKIFAIPPFKNVSIEPEAPLSASILDWSSKGKTYAWQQYHLPEEFRNKQLEPLFQQFAMEKISKDKFIELLTQEFATLK